jgi:uncharacterized protein
MTTERTRVRRVPARGVYDREAMHAILDDGFVCHLGFVDEDHPVVIPTLYVRAEDQLYVHGSAASRAVRRLRGGVPVCLTVTLVDGLVLARSAFHHSVNYRSVVVFGQATQLDEPAEKLHALEALTEALVKGRWADVRPPTAQELKGTSVLRVPLDEASAKVRQGPPVDDEDDYELATWAGVIPLELRRLAPQPDARLAAGIPVPAYL